jgi:plastocyanin
MRVAPALGAVLAGLLAARVAAAAPVTVQVHAQDGRALGGVVVTLEVPGGTAARRAGAVRAVMDQVGRAFSPPILVVPVGSSVTFPNSDTVSHQVYSFSPARRFQLPLYRGTPYPPVVFDEPGVVTLGCNIHDDMIGYIVVTAASHYGLTDRQGTWSAADVAPGTWRVSLWHPSLPGATHTVERRVDVDRTAAASVAFRVETRARPEAAPAKPRSWDAY